MDSKQIKSAARKALMAADPHYHARPPRQQERFRAKLSGEAASRVDAVLLQEVLGISCTPETAREIWKELPVAKLNPLNSAKLLTTGIGADWIWLNESMADGINLLDFETLYDYDFDDHLYQEEANKRDIGSAYQARDYYALRFSRWARLIIDDQLYYATLHSLAGHLADQLEDFAHELIQALIPHQYVEGNEHGKRVKGGFLWDMRVDAAGQEKQLEELNSRWHLYLQQRWLELSKESVITPPAVYIQDIEEHGDYNRHFIFNNQRALEQVRWRSFLADCQLLHADYAEVASLETQEKGRADAWLRTTQSDIMDNFDPKVTKLTRKRKIVIAPGALDGLVDEDEGFV